MKFNPTFRVAAYRAYADHVRKCFEVKRDEIDRYVSCAEWDAVRTAAIDLAAIASTLRDVENKLADIEP